MNYVYILKFGIISEYININFAGHTVGNKLWLLQIIWRPCSANSNTVSAISF